MFWVILALLLLPVQMIVSGLVLKTLWFWFIVPLGVPALGVAQALGVATVVSSLTYRHDLQTKDVDGPVLIVRMFGWPLFCLAFGALYHAFM